MTSEPLDLPRLSGVVPCPAASGRRTLSVLSAVPSRRTSFSTTAPASPSHLFSLCLSVCLFVCLSVCLFVCLSARQFVHLSVCLSVCLPDCLFACLFVCLFVCLSIRGPSPPTPPPTPPYELKVYMPVTMNVCENVCFLFFSPNLCAWTCTDSFVVLRTVTTLLTDCDCTWQTYGCVYMLSESKAVTDNYNVLWVRERRF